MDNWNNDVLYKIVSNEGSSEGSSDGPTHKSNEEFSTEKSFTEASFTNTDYTTASFLDIPVRDFDDQFLSRVNYYAYLTDLSHLTERLKTIETLEKGQWIPIPENDLLQIPFSCMKAVQDTCPETHIFAFNGGHECCSVGINLTLNGTICKGESVPCPHEGCNTAVTLDKCQTGFHKCDEQASCNPLVTGRYRCWCNEGYHNPHYLYPKCEEDKCSLLEHGDGLFCEDQNECEIPNDNQCHKDYANCTNNAGSYSCECNMGFTDTFPSFPGKNCKCEAEGYSINDGICAQTVFKKIRRVPFFHITGDLGSNVVLNENTTYHRYRIPAIKE